MSALQKTGKSMTKTQARPLQPMKNKAALQKEWLEAKAIFTPEELRIRDVPVMPNTREEKVYVETLAAIAAANGGCVLEVGFGLGISAGLIQTVSAVTQHIIIEPHPDVIAWARQKFPEALHQGRMEIMAGFWEDVSPQLTSASFDGILFDTTPLSTDEFDTFYEWEFFHEAYRLLKTGGVFTYFCIEIDNERLPQTHVDLLTDIGFSHVSFEVVAINPTASYPYWTHKTIIAPIARK